MYSVAYVGVNQLYDMSKHDFIHFGNLCGELHIVH